MLGHEYLVLLHLGSYHTENAKKAKLKFYFLKFCSVSQNSPSESPPPDTPIQSHANVDHITFDSFTSANVMKLRQGRDRLELARLRKGIPCYTS